MNSGSQHPSPSGRGAGGEGRRLKAALPEDVLDRARRLRHQQTDAESLIWYLLRNRAFLGFKFRRQYPFPPYTLDFYCDELKLAIELDGGQHNEGDEMRRDERRSAYLATRGVKVLRYWNHDVLTRTEAVLEDLYSAVSSVRSPSPPAPLPEGEGRKTHV
jgi:very-short-patch-repair endonuclease